MEIEADISREIIPDNSEPKHPWEVLNESNNLDIKHLSLSSEEADH